MFLLPYTIAVIMQIFTPNYFATDVVEKCHLLPERAFVSNWFELDEIEKKAMLLFITRSLHPLTVNAGIFFQMNLDTFLKVKTLGIVEISSNYKQGTFYNAIE